MFRKMGTQGAAVFAFRYYFKEWKIWDVLILLGNYSADMYLIHIFVYRNLFKNVVWNFMHPIWIIPVAVLLTFVTAWIFGKLKEQIHFNQFVNGLLRRN